MKHPPHLPHGHDTAWNRRRLSRPIHISNTAFHLHPSPQLERIALSPHIVRLRSDYFKMDGIHPYLSVCHKSETGFTHSRRSRRLCYPHRPPSAHDLDPPWTQSPTVHTAVNTNSLTVYHFLSVRESLLNPTSSTPIVTYSNGIPSLFALYPASPKN
jgi:hypothetical protein